MSEVLAPFSDAEDVVTAIVASALPGQIYTEIPEKFIPPVIQVHRTGGSDNGITDKPTIEVTTFGATRAQAWELDGVCRQLILAAGGTEHAGVLVDSTRTITPSQQLPDPRSDVRVVTSSYRLGIRRPYQP